MITAVVSKRVNIAVEVGQSIQKQG